MILDLNGYVVTNALVVDSGRLVQVRLAKSVAALSPRPSIFKPKFRDKSDDSIEITI